MANLACVGLLDLAVQTAENLRRVDPVNEVDHAVSAAVALAWAGRDTEALRVAKGTADAHPRDVEAWAGLVEVYRTLGDREAADAALERAVELAEGEFGEVAELLDRFDEDDLDES